MDPEGLSIGIVSFLIMMGFAFLLLERYDLNRVFVLYLTGICALGHFLGGLGYYWYTINYGSDSDFYFRNATMYFGGSGYYFAFFLMGYLRHYLVGDSLLGIFLILSSLAFLGSILYLLTYKILIDRLSHTSYFLTDPQTLLLPGLLLLCWPSYFFWTAGMKDNLAFLSISLFFFTLAHPRKLWVTFILLGLAAFLGLTIRPYLMVIVVTALASYIILYARLRPSIKFILFSSIFFIIYFLFTKISIFTVGVKVNSDVFDSVSKYAIKQQHALDTGSSVGVPTHDPRFLFLFLPYLMFINVFMPLFYGANNFVGIISSLENIILLYWAIFFMLHWGVWKEIRNQIKIANFFMLFFLVGVAFLSMMNTNLGVAMREKMMFVPAFLIVIFLVYSYKRILLKRYLMAET